jgi:hypothetical protein
MNDPSGPREVQEDRAVREESPGERPEGRGVLVVGVGHFGGRALGELRRLHPRQRLLAVDQEARALEPWRGQGVEVHQGEAVTLLDRLLETAPPRWVVAAVPFHLAYAWATQRLSRARRVKRIPLPQGLPIPNPLWGASGDVYSSFATFVCPEHCPEPKGRCTATGERRPHPLFQLLADLELPGFRVLGLRSHQLAAGVGGYLVVELWRLLEAAEASPGNVILYTACQCHGVLSGLRVDS